MVYKNIARKSAQFLTFLPNSGDKKFWSIHWNLTQSEQLITQWPKKWKKLFKITSKAKINVFLFSFPLYFALTGSFSTTPIGSFFLKSNFILAFEDINYTHCTLLSNFSWLWISKFGIQKRNFYWEYFLRPLFAAIIEFFNKQNQEGILLLNRPTFERFTEWSCGF